MLDNLYREEILEHYQNPLHFGRPERFDVSTKQLNPFCGDEVEIFVSFENTSLAKGVKKKTPLGCKSIGEVNFVGKGCAISIAAASILTDFAKGKSEKELTNFREEDMLRLLKIAVSETRKKCAFLPLFVLKDCLYGAKSKS